MMRGLVRTCEKVLRGRKDAWVKKCIEPPAKRRSFVTQAQKRRATTDAGSGLTFPVVDHHYEYVFLRIEIGILTNTRV